VLLISFAFTTFSQQRIGFELGTRMTNLNFTFHYQKVFKTHFIWSGGVFGGTYGQSFIDNDTSLIYTGARVHSPYSNVNADYSDTTGTYHLISYDANSRAIGIQLGLGYFHEFGVVHGIRFNANFKVGYASVETGSFYRSLSNYTTIRRWQWNNHMIAAFSPELYHTIRIGGRTTFYYGIRLPYFFSIDRLNFDPKLDKDVFYNLEPDLCIGLTYQVGKCD